MVRTIGYRWHLRRLMAEKDMYATTQLRPLLAERGVVAVPRAGLPAGHRGPGAAEPGHPRGAV